MPQKHAVAATTAKTGTEHTCRSIFSGLGLYGLATIEPIVLAALTTEAPLLLIGPHGTGKSLLLTRIAEALNLEFRHYNASLLNFDDLVGFPLPGKDGSLEYVRTAADIASAQRQPLVRQADLKRTTSWRYGQVIFEDDLLGVAIQEMNRYAKRRIAIADPALAQLRLSGAFETGQTGTFIEALTTYFPISVARQNSEEIVLAWQR